VQSCFMLARVRSCFMLARVCTPSSLVREREKERERKREMWNMSRIVIFIFERNGMCLDPFKLSSIERLMKRDSQMVMHI